MREPRNRDDGASDVWGLTAYWHITVTPQYCSKGRFIVLSLMSGYCLSVFITVDVEYCHEGKIPSPNIAQ